MVCPIPATATSAGEHVLLKTTVLLARSPDENNRKKAYKNKIMQPPHLRIGKLQCNTFFLLGLYHLKATVAHATVMGLNSVKGSCLQRKNKNRTEDSSCLQDHLSIVKKLTW